MQPLPLHDAARAGDLEQVELWLSGGADPNARESEPLQRIPSMLLEAGEELVEQAGFSFCRTPLMLAAAMGHAAVVERLLRANGDPRLKDGAGHTAMTQACRAGFLEVVQLLARAGDSLKQRGPGKATLLHLAVQSGQAPLVSWLIQQGLKVDLTDADGDTPLLVAAAEGHLALVECLLQAGARVDLTSRGQRTPLTALLSATQRIQIQPSQAREGGFLYVQWTDQGVFGSVPLPEDLILPLTEALLRSGAEVNPRDVSSTPLLLAAQFGRARLVTRLLEAGADPNRRSSVGMTPLEVARTFGHSQVVSLLEPITHAPPPPEAPESRSRPGRDLPIPDFTKSDRAVFHKLLEELSQRLGASWEPVPEIPGAAQLHLNSQGQPLDLERWQGELQEQGLFLFEPGDQSESPARLMALPTRDRYQAIAAMGTNGANCGLGPGDIVKWLQRLEKRQPFVLLAIGYNLLAGRFLTPISQPRKLARQMYDFCPDIVDQGTGTVEELAEALASSDRLFLWWD